MENLQLRKFANLTIMETRYLRRYTSDDFTYRTIIIPPRHIRPEPWRNHPRANEARYLPYEFCLLFTDRRQLRTIMNKEPDYISNLKHSIDVDGLREPVTMFIDDEGKLRYHDGHHRLAAIGFIEDMSHVPVILERSDGRIRGYGRRLSEEIEGLFDILDRDHLTVWRTNPRWA